MPVASVNPKPKLESHWYRRKDYVNAEGIRTSLMYKAVRKCQGTIRPVEDIICWYDSDGNLESIQYDRGTEVFVDHKEEDEEMNREDARDIAAG